MTKIQWTNKTWNPVTGCTKISPGCTNCYAERMAIRQAWMECKNAKRKTKYINVVTIDKQTRGWNGKTFCDESALEIPLKRKKPTTYFVCSMGDLFHESVPFEFIDKVMQTISCYPQRHIFQVLTKRPERMAKYFKCLYAGLTKFHDGKEFQWPFKNLWLGVTAENQEMADKRIPILLQIPAAIRFVSIEPCLEDINLTELDDPNERICLINGLTGNSINDLCEVPYYKGLDWVIVGAESGPKARYCPLKNIRSIVNQCKDAGVKCFVKQIHMWKAKTYSGYELLQYEENAKEIDSKLKRVLVKDINLFPKDLQIREYPKGGE